MTKHESMAQVQREAAESAERAAAKCEAAGNHANAAHFRRLAEIHRTLAAAIQQVKP